MFFIGDVHGKFDTYRKLVERMALDYRPFDSIQLGDMGIGFKNSKGKIKDGNFPNFSAEHHGWIRGNHDNPEECRKYPGYLGDFGYLEDEDIFFLGGAWSCDQYNRTEGVSWWADEELSYAQFNEAFQLYNDVKPLIVATHDCPQIAVHNMPFSHHYAEQRNVTRSSLDMFFKEYKPALWIFGHHHQWWEKDLMGTHFVCVPELEVYDADRMKRYKWRNC